MSQRELELEINEDPFENLMVNDSRMEINVGGPDNQFAQMSALN